MFLTVVVFLVNGVISIREPETPPMAGDGDPETAPDLDCALVTCQAIYWVYSMMCVCVGLSVIGSLVCMLKVFCVELGIRNEKCVCVSMRT